MRLEKLSSRRTRWLVAALLALPLTVLAAPSAQAASGPFTIDGNVPDSGTTQLTDLYGNVKELGPANGSATKIGVINSAPVPMLGYTNPNGQVDLRNAWLEVKKDATTGDDWLYFAWERDSNKGSGFIAYEFMQDPAPAGCTYDTATDQQLIDNCNPWANRKAGDFMILWDQSGTDTQLWLRTWSGTAPNLTLSDPEALDVTVSAAKFSTDGYRGEAAVDLTATIFGGSTACKSFANTIPSTVTGNSDQADYKDTILQQAPPITNCESSVVTTPKTGAGGDIPAGGLSIGTGVVPVTDSAAVDITGGTAAPAGHVSFWLCKVDDPALCATGGTAVGSTDLSGTSYPVTVPSPTAYVTSAGRYCWRATFSGDSANGIPPDTDASANECFTVNPVDPTLTTTASPGVLVGGTVSDTATFAAPTQPASPVINLTGTSGPAPGGSITFKLYGPGGSCTGEPVFTTDPSVSVTGSGPYTSPGFATTAAGTYHWVATYTGGSPNTNDYTANATCTDTNEDVVVSTVPSTLSTAQSWVPNDTMWVYAPAGGDLDGTATFTLYHGTYQGAGYCSSGTVVYGPVKIAVAGPSPQKVSTENEAVAVTAANDGSFWWTVSYDSKNGAQRSIGDSCQETSALTITNGGRVSSSG